MVLLFPTIVMSLRMTGSPLSSLLTLVSLCVLPLGNTIVSAPLPFAQRPLALVSLLAALMALTNVHVPPALIVAAIAGA